MYLFMNNHFLNNLRKIKTRRTIRNAKKINPKITENKKKKFVKISFPGTEYKTKDKINKIAKSIKFLIIMLNFFLLTSTLFFVSGFLITFFLFAIYNFK